MKGDFESAFEQLDRLEDKKVSPENLIKIRRVLDVLLIGEFYGLPTLKSILSVLGIKSTNLYKLWRAQKFGEIKKLALNLSLGDFEQALSKLAKQSDASWSRSQVTVIVDDSIFKTWLKNMPRGAYYDKFFSGQIKRTVHGFRVSLIGVAIGDDFYPLYFQVVPKGGDTKKVALNLLKKVQDVFTKVADKEDVAYPNLYFSADSGFTYDKLIKYCEQKNIGFIGVPKKTNVFTFQEGSMNLKSYIEKEFIPQEEAYKAERKRAGKEEEPFLLRVRCYYKAQGREVVLLFFRLKGSNKVTVIFCSHLAVMKKTLRRRFFQRTKIELFFRFLKDTLKIQKSKSERYGDFVKKLSVCIIKAIFCIKLQKFFRKKHRTFKGWSYYKIRQHIIYHQVHKSILEDLI